jgi:hypothetical protein
VNYGESKSEFMEKERPKGKLDLKISVGFALDSARIQETEINVGAGGGFEPPTHCDIIFASCDFVTISFSSTF